MVYKWFLLIIFNIVKYKGRENNCDKNVINRTLRSNVP